jgi:hypothetical protein
MTQIFDIRQQNVLHAASRYPSSTGEAEEMGLTGKRNAEMRAMTIAAFRVAQNNEQISTRAMDADLLLFLLAGSTTVLNHWQKVNRLVRSEDGFRLTPAGLTECQDSLLGRVGAYSTSEQTVQAWVQRMQHGDIVASRQAEFPNHAWPD